MGFMAEVVAPVFKVGTGSDDAFPDAGCSLWRRTAPESRINQAGPST